MRSSFGREISIISRQSKMYLERVLKPFNVRVGEHRFILNVENGKHLNQQQLCDMFAIDKAQATRSIASLVEKGILKREKNPEDKREYLISLTEKGEEVKAEIFKQLDYWRDILKGDMPQEKLDEVIDILSEFRKKAIKENEKYKNMHEN